MPGEPRGVGAAPISRRVFIGVLAATAFAACGPSPDGTRAPRTRAARSSAAAAPAPPRPVSYPSYSLEFLRSVFRGDPTVADPQRWQWQILQGDLTRPAGVAHEYRYATSVLRASDPAGIMQCVRPSQVSDSWLLRDDTGALLRRGGDRNPDDVALDVGNPDFQAAATTFLVEKVVSGGWSGVSLDEINSSFLWAWSRRPASYPDDRSWQDAEVAFVQQLGAALRAAGAELAINIGEALDLDFIRRVAEGGQVVYSEFFVEGGPTGGFTQALLGSDWDTRVRWLEQSMATAPATLVQDRLAPGTDTGYGLATFLLGTTGAGAYGLSYSYDPAGGVYPPRFADALALGAPRTERYLVADGVWQRDFTGGRVLVNSTTRGATIDGIAVPRSSGTLLP